MITRILATGMLATALVVGGNLARAEQQTESPPSEAKQARSLTVYPVGISPAEQIPLKVRRAIARVVGIGLERAGVERVELADEDFTPPETDDLDQIAAGFGKFVREHSIETEYALCAELLGTPKTGLKAIRTILVDQQGNVVLAARDDAKTYAKTSDLVPKDPMTSSLFVASRIGKLWNLADPLRKDAPQGKLAEQLRRESGVPPQTEIDAILKRQQAAKARLRAGDPLKVLVYPIRLGDTTDRKLAERLAKSLEEVADCDITATDVDPKLEIKGHYNEQKVLWDTARAIREFVRKNPPRADYVLYADYGVDPSGEHEAQFVHFILCDKAGDWVVVDFQNSHHADFQQIDPKTPDDCNRLVVRRVQAGLAE